MAAGAETRDRFGIGYRPELFAGILAFRDRIDVVEAIADDFLNHGNHLRALRTLARQLPVTVHGIGLGLGGACEIPAKKLDDFARWVGTIEPESWTEHLAFVRAGGVEIGHLAAPPRRPASVDNAIRNIQRATRAVGSIPAVENVATLIDPPGSTMNETAWVGAILQGAGVPLLLDLHNLYANADSFGFDPFVYIDSLPPGAVRAIHLAGGRRVPFRGRAGGRIVDDHLHEVPDPVFELLAHVAERTDWPLTVVLERDGNYPAFEILLAELSRARSAVRLGRGRRRGCLRGAAA